MDELDDTPESAPPVPRTAASINASKIRSLRESPQYKARKKDFRDECARFRSPEGVVGKPCWLCGNAIDYKLAYPHPLSWSVDHILTAKERPDLLMDVSNWAASHLDCNIRRGSDAPVLDIGQPSEVW